jgi:hypothetical protein
MGCKRAVYPRARIHRHPLGVPVLLLCLLTLSACATVTAASKRPAIVVGDGFRIVLREGWTANGPVADSGFTAYDLYQPSSDLDISVATLPIPNDPTNSQVAAIMYGNIETIALTINGTQNVQPTLTEAAHLVSFVGESCARMGLSSGTGQDSRIITCRRDRVIYDISVSGSGSTQQMLSDINEIASGWSWT